MTLIQRYYVKEFLKVLGILSMGLSMVASLIELINRIDDFMPSRPSLLDLLYYGLLNIPTYFLYTMPVCILLGSLFVMGNAGRRRETIAIRAAGGSLKRVFTVLILTGLIMTILSFLVGEFISPPALRKAHSLRDGLSGKNDLENRKVLWNDSIWMRSGQAIVRMELYLQDRGIIKGISIFEMDGDRLSERIEADYAEWRPAAEGDKQKDGVWVLKEGIIYDINTGGTTNFRQMQTDLIGPPRVFSLVIRKPEEMNFKELIGYEKRLRQAGFKNNKLSVDVQSRLSYPLINLIMMVLGLSLAASGEMRSGLITAAIGIGISLFYWLCLSLALSMSYAGILPAMVGPWSIPLIFGFFAIYKFSKIPE